MIKKTFYWIVFGLAILVPTQYANAQAVDDPMVWAESMGDLVIENKDREAVALLNKTKIGQFNPQTIKSFESFFPAWRNLYGEPYAYEFGQTFEPSPSLRRLTVIVRYEHNVVGWLLFFVQNQSGKWDLNSINVKDDLNEIFPPAAGAAR